MVRFRNLIVAILLYGSPALAVAPAPITSIESQLDFLTIRLGDAVTQLQNGETLSILKGDRFKIERAQLVGNRVKADRIDLVGYAAAANARDDSKRWIDSNKDMLPRFALAGTSDRYAVKVFRGGNLSGEAFIQLVEPTLSYATVRINGKSQMLRADETLRVKASDQFKLEKVVTNFGEDKAVTVRIQPIEFSSQGIEFKLYEMQLVRKNLVFAKFSLQVRGT